MCLAMKHMARYMEISMYLAMKQMARYIEISMYLMVTLTKRTWKRPCTLHISPSDDQLLNQFLRKINSKYNLRTAEELNSFNH